MTEPIQIAVVGHTNAGKTSLLRTLTRRVSFGEVADRPGTTRHVEAIDLKAGGESAVRFFDTPGLEDSVTLLDYLGELENCITPPDRIRAFLQGPEARSSFEQEAKVLRKMLDVEAAIYVIDTREPVLPKFRAEIEILASCAKPVMPVLNFVRDASSRKQEWLDTLSAYGLHAAVQFDAVAPFVGSEQQLYLDLGTLLRARRALLSAIVDDLAKQARERRTAACRVIADLLLSLAALRREMPKEDFALEPKRQAFLRGFRESVLAQARRAIDDLLLIYGFRAEDAEDTAALPWLEGRWENDLFNPETLRDASRKLGAGAAFGAAIGLVADVASAGLSLGSGTAVGAAIGGIASQGFAPFGRKLLNRARGIQELTLENEVLLVLAENMTSLLRALELRGHAASGKITIRADAGKAYDERLRQLIKTVQPARSHPNWEMKPDGRQASDAQRSALAAQVTASVEQLAAQKIEGHSG